MRNWLIATLFPALLLASCARSTDRSSEPVKRYSMHGEVIRVDPDGKVATIKHEKIQGWMEAMTMGYPVKDQKDLGSLQPDHCVDATVFVQGDAFWIGEIKPLDTPPDQCVAAAPK